MQQKQTLHIIYDGYHLQKSYHNHYRRSLNENQLEIIIRQLFKEVHKLQVELQGFTSHFYDPVVHFVTGKFPVPPPEDADLVRLAELMKRSFERKISGSTSTAYDMKFHMKDLELRSPTHWQQNEEKSDALMVNILDTQLRGNDYVVLSSLDGANRRDGGRPIREAFRDANSQNRKLILLRFQDDTQNVSPALRASATHEWLAEWVEEAGLIRISEDPR